MASLEDQQAMSNALIESVQNLLREGLDPGNPVASTEKILQSLSLETRANYREHPNHKH